MGEGSRIEWTDHTFNPWWGCAKVSPGCEHCYAESSSKRWGHEIWGHGGERRFFGEKHWNEPLRWNRAVPVGERRRVFCASMADVFEDRADLHTPRHHLWRLISKTQDLDWLLLTKRPENLAKLLPWGPVMSVAGRWLDPWPNVWIGVTVEDQQRADERIPRLLEVPAVVRFLSCEPLLGAVRLPAEALGECSDPQCGDSTWDHACTLGLPGVDWVIVGGESGPGARPMDPYWARSLRNQCTSAGVAFHFKQWGAHNADLVRIGKKASGRLLDGRTWDQFPEVRP